MSTDITNLRFPLCNNRNSIIICYVFCTTSVFRIFTLPYRANSLTTKAVKYLSSTTLNCLGNDLIAYAMFSTISLEAGNEN